MTTTFGTPEPVRVLVYCKDYPPQETGFALAFKGFCDALAQQKGEIVVTPVVPSSVPTQPADSKREESLIRLAAPFSTMLSANRIAPFTKHLNTIKSICNRFSYAHQIVKTFKAGNYDLLIFESGDDMLVIGAIPPRILRKSIIRFHSTGDTETARFGTSLMTRFQRAIIKHRVAPNLRVIWATNVHHLHFIKDFYYNNDPYHLANRLFAITRNTIGDFPAFTKPDRSSDRLVVTTLGRMDAQGVAQKGFTDLLLAVSQLPPDHTRRLALRVIGDGPRRQHLMDLTADLRLDCVEFLGSIPNSTVRKLLIESDVAVLVSRFEGQSMFAIEAMLASCAVIYSDTGALTELVDGNGWLVPPQDVTAISSALLDAIGTEVAQIRELGARSRQIALEKFSFDAVSKEAKLNTLAAKAFLDSAIF